MESFLKKLEESNILNEKVPQLVIEDGKISYYNDMLLKLFEMEKGDLLLGKSLEDISPSIQIGGEKTREYYKKIVSEIYSNGEVHFKWVVLPGRNPKFLEIHGKNLMALKKDTMILNVYDITMWTKFSQMFYEDGLNNSFYEHKEIILLIDSKNGNILDYNKAAKTFYRFPDEKFKAMNIKDINTNSEVFVRDQMKRAESETSNTFIFEHRIGDNTTRKVKVHSRPIILEGKTILCSLIVPVINKDSMKITNLKDLALDNYMNNISKPVVVVSKEGRITDFNYSFKKIIKQGMNDVCDMYFYDVLNIDNSVYDYSDAISNLVNNNYGNTYMDIAGKYFKVEKFTGSTIEDSMNNSVIIFTDQTQKMENKMKIELYEKILYNVNIGVIVTDRDNNIKWINKGFEKITDYKLSDVRGKNPDILKSGEHEKEFYQRMWNSINLTGEWNGEIINKKKNGVVFVENLKIIRYINSIENEINYIGIFSDISEEKKKSRRMWDLSYKDALTGLNNRNYFIERIGYELKFISKYEGKIALLLVDIENFKSINTVMGIKFGDLILKKFADVLRSSIPFNSSISRFDGDEFIILLSNITDSKYVIDFIDYLNETIRENLIIDNKPFHIDYNIGVSMYPDDGNDPFELVNKSEIAKNKVKSLVSENYIFYKDAFKKEINKKHNITRNLKEALMKKELYLVFQPIVQVKAGTVSGFEVLLRWNSRNLGRVLPEDFIEIAESSGDIVEIGYWIIEKSFEVLSDIDSNCLGNKCKFLETGNKNEINGDIIDENFFISINLSLIQIESSMFLEKIKDITDKYKIDPNRVEFEITESVLSKNYFSLKDNINKLRQMGFSIAIDDFGTGYSSFSLVKMMNISKIKIDKFFLQDFFDDDTYKNILETIILMGKNLNMNTVVEGVETKEHLDFIKLANADYYQGFYYSKPKEMHEFFVYFE